MIYYQRSNLANKLKMAAQVTNLNRLNRPETTTIFSNFNNDHQSSVINFISGRNFVTIPARIYEIIIKVGHRTNVAMVTFNYPSPINQIRRQLNNDSF